MARKSRQIVMEKERVMQPGKVFIVGAGPGDPRLITVRGLELLQQAQVLCHDRLIPAALLAQAHPEAEIINVGKSSQKERFPQADINQLLVAKALEGKMVVRLKGGDPFLFGLGGEECLACQAAGVPYEVVPGVSSALAVPAYAGIPVTHPGLSTSLTILTGHNGDPAELPAGGTVVVLMGVKHLPQITQQLQQKGWAENTPAAVIYSGTTAGQEVVVGTLATIATRATHLPPPSLLVVGQVVGLAEQLAWFSGGEAPAGWLPAKK